MKRLHAIGFNHAFDGIKVAFSQHPNFIIHTLLGTLALTVAFIVKVSRTEIIILLAIFFLGLVVEMINTSIESVVDLVTQEWRENAKLAKDISAGAVLIYAVGAVVVALLILIPKL